MSDDGLLGRAELERAFAALGDRLVRRGVVADLFIVGGAAMALAYDAERVTRKREVFDHPGIRVMAASPEHVFAMKAFAARTRDEEDLRTLAQIIGITTVDAASELCERFFPGELLPARSRAMLEDLFGFD
jgi:hypothetical protein